MDATKTAILTPEDHDRFIREGFLVVKQIIPPDLVERTVHMLETGGHVEGQPIEPPLSDLIAECVGGRLYQAVNELMGHAPFETAYPVDDRPRPYLPDEEWSIQHTPHIDFVSQPELVPDWWGLNVFLALTKMPSHGGALLISPGSAVRFHAVATRRGAEAAFTAAVRGRFGDLVEFLSDPGDAIFLQHLMCHDGSKNTSNPQARHMLDVRCRPVDPIRPGDKPFDQMSTLEKACSKRYLASRFGSDFVVPQISDDAPTAAALRAGFGTSSPIRAQVTFRWDGDMYVAYTCDADPNAIHFARTANLVTWDETTIIASPAGPVHALYFDARYGPTITIAGRSASAILHGGEDLRSWTPLAHVDGMRLSRLHNFPMGLNEVDYSQALPYVDPSAPHEVRWRSRCTEDLWVSIANGAYDDPSNVYGGVGSWPNDGVVCTFPAGTVVEDAHITTVREAMFAAAFVVDLQDGPARYELFERNWEELKRSGFRPPTFDRFSGNLRPFGFTSSTPPRRLRIYERARNVSLVTYLRDVDGGTRVFWGTIDWTAPTPTVNEITTGAQLRAALACVGLL